MVRNVGMWPPWTRSEDTASPLRQGLSADSREGLIAMARTVQRVNENVLLVLQQGSGVVERENAYCGWNQMFIEDDFRIMCEVCSIQISSEDLSVLLRYLSRKDYPDIWRKFIQAMLRKVAVQSIIWGQAWKETALEFLELRDEAAVRFDEIHEELRAYDRQVYDGIFRKLEILKHCEFIERDHHSREVTFSNRETRLAAKTSRNPKNPTLVVIVAVTTALSIISFVQAWRPSNNQQGTISDVDFYLVTQNSEMQFLGLFTAIYTLARKSTSSAWGWAQAFSAIGALCAVAAVVTYLYIPTMWSALVSFFASIAQAVTALELELALMSDNILEKEKEQ